ncbi:hypothetical protein NA57DRAFT_34123 [Rhizodiscina lignyota]|uniref:peptidylprolyl isomerase n=1 Tax=Rhizodiscina lignyota TaxID=1504668 RepID=A0A9P4M8U5_9PEZI|nr:hypothetical protein NA57DRAFT_34123 [Rhizodiscina lignyota]
MGIPQGFKRVWGIRVLSSLLLLAPLNTAVLLADRGDVDIDVTRTGDCTQKSHRGDTLNVYYTLRLKDAERVTETNVGTQPFEFTLGTGAVIQGWEIGLEEMCLGEERRLTIPPELAYGAFGSPPAIPGGATLVFDTELVGLNGVAAPTAAAESEPSDALADAVLPPDLPVVDVPPPIESVAAEVEAADKDESDNGECRLLGPFAIFIQGALGALALLSLVYKRWRETPRRPLKIWCFDVSKQVLGSVLTHILNLLMSMLSSGQFDVATAVKPGSPSSRMLDNPNPCSFYLLNLAIDTTLGIPILVLLLRILYHLFMYTALANPPESIRSGNYGTPPRYGWWLKQSFIYFIALFIMKLCVYALLQMLPWLAWVGDWALRWTEGNEALQIAFSMLVFPLIMNALQYWIIDNFIKDPAGGSEGAWDGHEQLPQEDEDDDHRRGHDDDDDEEEAEDEIEEVENEDVKAVRQTLKDANPTALPAYDEHVDGHGGGSSRGESRGGSSEEEVKT